MSVTAPSLTNSGEPFTLSWAHTGGSGNYAYQISYACADGLSLKAPLPTGGTQSVPCNTPFNYTNAMGALVLTPSVTGNKQISASFTVSAIDLAHNTTNASGAATMTVLPAKSVSTTKTTSSASSGTKYIPATKVASTLYGLPNLTATIVSTSPTATGYSVEFLIKNTGTNTTPAGWSFAANVPTNALAVSSGYNYQSQAQQALHPGDSILYTMNFSLSAAQSYYPYNNTYNNNYSNYPYPTNCGYQQSYTYNGYANYPNGSTYTCNTNYNNSYNNYGYGYSYQNYNYQNYNYGSRVFSVMADPSGYISETSKTDNTASVSF